MSIPTLNQNSLENRDLVLEASKAGAFYFEMPKDCQELVPDAVDFSYGFPNDETIKQYSDGKFGGYHKRDHNQIESFYVERKDWNRILPENLQKLAHKMDPLMNRILPSILEHTEIPQKFWESGTGGLTQNNGQRHFSYNHYRSEINEEGINPHKDFGFLSILFVEKKGLEVLQNQQWIEVPPKPGHFVVIVGKAFETLANDPEKVSAAWHRVRHLEEERISFAITSDNEESLPVRRYLQGENRLESVHPNYSEYLKECFKETYSPE